MDDHVRHSLKTSFYFALDLFGELMGLIHGHLRVHENVKINANIIRSSPAPDLMAPLHALNGKNDFFNLTTRNGCRIAQDSRAFSTGVKARVAYEKGDD